MKTNDPGQRTPDPDSFANLKILISWVFCAMGLIASIVGLVEVDISLEAAGIVAGIIGYALGAQKLGTATIALATVLLIVTLVIGTGMVPGIEPSDPLFTST